MPDLDIMLRAHLDAATPTTATGLAGVRRRARRTRGRRVAAGTLAVAAVVGAGAVLLGGPEAPGAATIARHPSPTDPPAPDPDRPHGALGEDSSTSCVAAYPRDLADRQFAFDGTVTGIGPGTTNRPGKGRLDGPSVTFDVERWYSGGAGPEARVDMQTDPADIPVGTRLLVSGDDRWGQSELHDPIGWTCGFVRYWEQDEATEWAMRFRR
jgi:hypothetical protein